jgi:hypothetical protein
MKNICVLLLAILIQFVPQHIYAQKFLTLQKNSFKKRIIYYPGDEIFLKVDDNKFTISGVISSLNTNSINFNGQNIALSRITEVSNPKKRAFHRAMSKQALFAIAPILVFDAGNRFFNSGERPIVSRQALEISAFFATISLALMPYKVKRYNVTKRWKLKVVDVSP